MATMSQKKTLKLPQATALGDSDWAALIAELASKEEALMNERPLAGEDYIFVTLVATSDGNPYASLHTMGVGWTDNKCKFEKRQPSIIEPRVIKERLARIGEPPLIVNSLDDLIFFKILGGHGIIRKKLVDEYWPEIGQSHCCAYGGHEPGFVNLDSIPTSQFAKRPNKKVKARVRNRDKNGCVLCNSSEKLAAHHILPRTEGGRTVEKNLATLCESCHKKLHETPVRRFDHNLYSRIGVDIHGLNRKEVFWQGVERYRNLMLDILVAIIAGDPDRTEGDDAGGCRFAPGQ